MIPYKRDLDPPAPFVEVRFRHPTTDRQETLLAKLDTGADISGIPRRLVDRLGLATVRTIPIAGYDQVRTTISTYVIRLEVRRLDLRYLEVVPLPGEHALLGRDVLNRLYTYLKGPQQAFDLSLSPLA